MLAPLASREEGPLQRVLEDAIIDPAFGAMALELILRTADSWGAETLFAEASPLSESVLAELDHPRLLVFKELDRAIAAAFQIAMAQQRPACRDMGVRVGSARQVGSRNARKRSDGRDSRAR